MVLRFFAVVGKGEVLSVNIRKLHGGSCAQGNALVGRSVKVLCLAVKVHHVGARVVLGKLRERGTGTEFSGVDEVRSVTTTLGHEIAELEGAGFDKKMDKGVFNIHSYAFAPQRSAKMLANTFVSSVRTSMTIKSIVTSTQSPM